MKVLKVAIENNQSKVVIPVGLRLLIRRCCHAVLKNEGILTPAEISVSFVDNDQIKELNSQYREKDMPTDVLSFPLIDNGDFTTVSANGKMLLGDIVISMEKAVEQADLYGHTIQREAAFLTVHSMLHLLGYDHENNGLEAVKMREKEEQILSLLGLARTSAYLPIGD